MAVLQIGIAMFVIGSERQGWLAHHADLEAPW